MVYTKLPARYTKGTLKLHKRLRLPEGAVVRVTVMFGQPKTKRAKTTKRKYTYPNRPLPRHTLRAISGIVSLGGDALADSESLYD